MLVGSFSFVVVTFVVVRLIVSLVCVTVVVDCNVAKPVAPLFPRQGVDLQSRIGASSHSIQSIFVGAVH